MLAASKFSFYFQEGKAHILDLTAYDHLLFVVALASLYLLQDWKKVLILVTAFTIGHSITLALATFEVVSVPAPLVEFLIPVTIFITAVSNIVNRRGYRSKSKVQANYLFALFFGLIHGLGFSNYIRFILIKSDNFVLSFLAANLGLEWGQLVIVFYTLIVGTLLVSVVAFRIKRVWWIVGVNTLISAISIYLAAGAWPW